MKTITWNFGGILAYLCLLHRTECAITAWTKPDIKAASGSGILVEKINDGVTTGTTNTITIAATPGVTGYSKVSQDPAVPALAIDSGSGVVTLTSGTVSYSTSTSLTIVVSATDGTKTETATVTINVNAAPAITAHNSTPCIADASTAGVNLIDLKATDPNSGTTFTWAIAASGNTGTAFAITTAGRIEVATGITLDMATTASYPLVITVADDSSTPLTATTTVTASVQTTCPSTSVQTTPSNSAAAVAISLETVLVVFLVKGFC